MSYGKTSACLVLEEAVKAAGGINIVGTIMSDFNKGLKFLETSDDKNIYEGLWKLWCKEFKSRIKDSNIQENIKRIMNAAVIGLARKHYRETMIKNNWISKNQKKIFEKASIKHDKEYCEKLGRKDDM